MELAHQTLYFFESFLVGGYGKNRVTTINEVFFFENVRSFFFHVIFLGARHGQGSGTDRIYVEMLTHVTKKNYKQITKELHGLSMDSGDSALFLRKRKIIPCQEKNIWAKNRHLKQIATWVKSNLSFGHLDPYCNPYYIHREDPLEM